MTSRYWLNLPVKDLTKSRTFFAALGFGFSDDNGNNEELLMMHVGKAGGRIFAAPQDFNGWYNCGFADLDGHRWNVLCMPRQNS